MSTLRLTLDGVVTEALARPVVVLVDGKIVFRGMVDLVTLCHGPHGPDDGASTSINATSMDAPSAPLQGDETPAVGQSGGVAPSSARPGGVRCALCPAAPVPHPLDRICAAQRAEEERRGVQAAVLPPRVA